MVTLDELRALPETKRKTELKRLWRAHGCAICGRTVPEEGALEGWDIELHHVIPRSRGGGWEPENIIGLCGELAPGRCHWRVTTNRVVVARWRWIDRLSGQESPLRLPWAPSQEVVVHREQVPEAPQRAPRTPQGRFDAIRGLVRRSNIDRLRAAVMLWQAYQDGDHEKLGIEWSDYYHQTGLSSGDVAKMMLAARIFGEAKLLELAEQPDVSLDRAYNGARLVKSGDYTVEEAAAEVVGQTAGGLVGLVNGSDPHIRCVCPTCGQNHVLKQED